MNQIAQVQILMDSELHMYSPVPRPTGEIVIACENGSVYRLDKEQKQSKLFTVGGQAAGIAMEPKNSNRVYLADLAHQAILVREITNNDTEPVTQQIAKEFEGEPFIGPNSIVLSSTGEKLFFTDSGPWAETNIQHPNGGVYLIEVEAGRITPLAYNCLAYPSGLCLSKEKGERFLYVCETGRNRLLRFFLKESCEFKLSVFYQFSGRFGPTAIACHPESGNLYIAHYDFKSKICNNLGFENNGEISILSQDGRKLGRVSVPGFPQIISLAFSLYEQGTLIGIDNTAHSTLFQFEVKESTLEKSEKEKASQY